jgi:tRNA dimethylallyltransferase
MGERLPTLVVLAGPTGGGKSAAALGLAREFGAEIINADAFQVYRGMEIGTAQPDERARGEIPHHLYGFQDPREGMSAASYAALADQAISDILARGRRALVVGGAGFYLRALLRGLFDAPPVDAKLRAELLARGEAEGGREALHEELSRVDPEAAARLPAADLYRVSRALEIYYQTGVAMSEHHRAHERPARYHYALLCIDPPAEELTRRQSGRVSAMFEAGWEAEVAGLLRAGVPLSAPGFRALGYRGIASLVLGERSRAEVIAEISREHKKYAKRQRTWLKREEGARFFSSGEEVRVPAAEFWGG